MERLPKQPSLHKKHGAASALLSEDITYGTAVYLLFLQDYRRFRRASLSSSYPGFPSSANMFFL